LRWLLADDSWFKQEKDNIRQGLLWTEGGRAKVQISDFMPTEIKARLDGIAASLENAGADLSGHERDIASAATEIKSLAATICGHESTPQS